MSGITVTITGGKALAAKLGQMSDAVAGKALERATVSGALLVANRAKENCPYKTGNLRRSIHVGGHAGESGGLLNTTGGDVRGNQNSRNHAEVQVGTDVEYAGPVEFGTAHRRGRPFLRPALDEQVEAVGREIGEALADLLRAI